MTASPPDGLFCRVAFSLLGRHVDEVIDLTEHLFTGCLVSVWPKYADVPGHKFFPCHLFHFGIVEIDSLKNHATCSMPLMSFSYSTAGDLRRMSAPAEEAMVRVSESSSYVIAVVVP